MTLQREEFTKKLAHLIQSGANLIYQDESSLCNWSTLKKAWSYKDALVEVPMNETRHAVTVVASIGNCLRGGFAVQLAKSTN